MAAPSKTLMAPSLCRFGNSRGILHTPRFVSIDLDHGRAFLSGMAKLGPWRRSTTRAIIVGVLAWLLALQGFAIATSPHSGFANVGVGAEQAISPAGEYCGAPGSGQPQTPCQDDHCQCCILCSSNAASGLAWIAQTGLTGAVFPATSIKRAAAWRFPGAESKPPAGWTSAWSQRAPPRFS